MGSLPDTIDFIKDKISIDSNIIIDFCETGYEKIISKVFRGRVYFSTLILKEIGRYDLSIFNYDGINIKRDEEIEYFNNLNYKYSNRLSEQDIHLITICKFNGFHCASNEKEIRAICKKEGIKVLGTISILIDAIKIKLIDNSIAEKMLDHMKKSTMYLDEALYAETIKNFNNCFIETQKDRSL